MAASFVAELTSLLKDAAHNNTASRASNKQRAKEIIGSLPIEELYLLMVQLVTSGGEPQQSASPSAAPDSPERGPKSCSSDQQLSLCVEKGASSGRAAPYSMDDTRHQHDSTAQQSSLQVPASGRCFLAESLDLNMGASYDWLSKASLADFSSTVAAPETASRKQQRALTPVAECSFADAAAEGPEGAPSCSTVTSCAQQEAAMHLAAVSSHHQHTKAAASAPAPAPLELIDAGWDDSPSCSPTALQSSSPIALQHTPAALLPRTAAVRQSAAESAMGWPNSMPLPVAAFTADTEEAQACIAYGSVQTPPSTALGAVTPTVGRSQHTQSAASCIQGGSTGGSRSLHAGGPGGSSKRSSGLGRALLAPVNALRRSLTGRRTAKDGSAPSAAAKAAPAFGSSIAKPLARNSAPPTALYGGSNSQAASAAQKQATSRLMAVQSRVPSFTAASRQPLPAQPKAVSASALASRKALSAAGSGAHSSRQPSCVGSNSYRPPAAHSQHDVATANAMQGSGRSPLANQPGSTARCLNAATAAAGISSRPCSQASAASVRSTRSVCSAASGLSAATGTAGGLPSFSGARHMAESSKQQHTPKAKLPQPRTAVAESGQPGVAGSPWTPASKAAMLANSPQLAAAAAAARTPGSAAASGSSSGTRAVSRLPSGTSGLQQGQQTSRHPVAAADAAASLAAAKQQPGARHMPQFMASQRPQQQQRIPPRAAPHHASPFSAHAGKVAAAHIAAGGSRIGGGGGSQLRRSRSCGSLAEMQQAVSQLRQMWQERAAHDATIQQKTLAHHVQQTAQGKRSLRPQGEGSTAAGPSAVPRPAAAMLHRQGPQHSSTSTTTAHGVSSRLPAPAGSNGNARAAAATAASRGEPGLPALNVCQSPTKPGPSQTADVDEPAVDTSCLLEGMGDIIRKMDACLAQDAPDSAHCGGGHGAAGATGHSLGGCRQPSSVAAAGLGMQAAAATPNSKTLVHKLLQPCAAAAAAGRQASAVAPGSSSSCAASGAGMRAQLTRLVVPVDASSWGAGGSSSLTISNATATGGEDDDFDAANPVESPGSPPLSCSSSQVSHGTGGLPRWNVYSAVPPPSNPSSSQEGQLESSRSAGISRQLF